MGKTGKPLKVQQIRQKLGEMYPKADCALDHRNPFELLVATILSAQCTDKRVNLVTPALFAAYPTPKAMAEAAQADVEALVHTTGFFRAKSKNIIGTAQALVTQHGGVVPKTLAELIKLPGVARKTANVVLGVCFGLAEGVVVDTHVLRVSHRLGLTDATTPQQVERDLVKHLPQKEWIVSSHRIIIHGRTLCDARRPRCEACDLRPVCRFGSR